MEVTSLTATHYQERPHAELHPVWKPGLAGLHTLNAAGGLSMIDILRRKQARSLTSTQSKQ
jgi:hypothetical protein